MPSYTRELTVLGLFGAMLWLPQCSQLTKVDWSLIPPPGGSSSGGAIGAAGAAGENTEAGEGGASGSLNEAGAGGEGGEGGEGGDVENGGGGASSGSGGSGGTLAGNGGGGVGGAIAGGGTGGAIILHPTCKLAPPTPTTPPDLTNAIVLFDGGSGGNGSRGPRGSTVTPYSGLDGACATAKDKLGLPQTDTHAVISLNLDDEIYKMPEKFGIPRVGTHVVSPLGIEIAASWNDLWKLTGIPISLVCAGVMPANVDTWLTGSGRLTEPNPQQPIGDGLYGVYDFASDLSNNQYSHACNAWTFGSYDADVAASVGSTISQRDGGVDGYPRFIRYLLYSCDQASSNLLCVAFNKAAP